MPFVALLDANVLYPCLLRDVLLSIAEAGLYRLTWTEEILDEMSRNILGNVPGVSPEGVRRLVSDMTGAFPEAMVSGYEPLESAMTNHEKDRHVLAAAVRGQADVLVTNNTKHFPPECCEGYDLDIQTADQFLWHAYDLRPEVFERAVRRMLALHTTPPQTMEQFLVSMESLAPDLVSALRAAGLEE